MDRTICHPLLQTCKQSKASPMLLLKLANRLNWTLVTWCSLELELISHWVNFETIQPEIKTKVQNRTKHIVYFNVTCVKKNKLIRVKNDIVISHAKHTLGQTGWPAALADSLGAPWTACGGTLSRNRLRLCDDVGMIWGCKRPCTSGSRVSPLPLQGCLTSLDEASQRGKEYLGRVL